MKNVLVVGYGKSAKSFIEYAKNKYNIFLVDDGGVNAIRASEDMNIEINEFDPNMAYDFILVSPGIPLSNWIYQYALDNEIKIIGEMGYSLEKIRGDIICVTGTNGKTTVSNMIYRILEKSFPAVNLVGNVGTPISKYIDTSKIEDVFVTEISSFQLETMGNVRSVVSLILNITPDHIKWHGSYEKYIESKIKLFSLDKNSFKIINGDDDILMERVYNKFDKVYTFSLSNNIKDSNCYVLDGIIYLFIDGEKIEVMKASELSLKGRHNLKNALAAILATYLYGSDIEDIKLALKEFKAIEHRYELVGTKNGVRFINDSKSTNPDSTIAALEYSESPTLLLAGGMDKGVSFTPMMRKIKKSVKKIYIYGECRDQMYDEALKEGINCVICDDLEEAFFWAYREAETGFDIVLSPACASWDMYKNFEERGKHFKELCRGIDV